MTNEQQRFAQLLRQTREATGLSRGALAELTELDTSYIYRLESGERVPSRDVVLTLAEALRVQGEAANVWLAAAGYAPLPLLVGVRGAVRTRGGGRRSRGGDPASEGWDTARWARWLEAIGLEEETIGKLMQAMESAGPVERQKVMRALRTTFDRAVDGLTAPVRTAVIPAAGGQHRFLAPHVMQHLLLQAIEEAVVSGVSQIVLVLAPGSADALFTPLKEALNLAVAPPVQLQYVEQPKAEGLGDAILEAREFISGGPFAVLLPDDVVRERVGRDSSSRELRRMMDAFRQLDGAPLVAVAPVSQSKMRHCGVAQLGAESVMSQIFPILRLVEKPDPADSICREPRALGIVGRYLLQPAVLEALRTLKAEGCRPVHLTDALERVRAAGQSVYGFELLPGRREDLGEVIGHAHDVVRSSADAAALAAHSGSPTRRSSSS